MGGIKSWKSAQAPIVYHHTSTLCTNLIWMSGCIEIEGRQEAPEHPQMGVVQSDTRFRRAMADFPAVAWFTDDINVPKCLIQSSLFLVKPETGESIEVPLAPEMANAIALLRLALGFKVADVGLTPWRDYRGYDTVEGRVLNETARDAGDDPDRWYVSETPVSLDHMSEIRVARSLQDLKMLRNDAYLVALKKMLAKAKSAGEKVYIPPAWLTKEQTALLMARMQRSGVQVL
jgi:hypothetical protein